MPSDKPLIVYDAYDRPVDVSAGMPIPHAYTFSGVFQGAWHTYWMLRHDEAMRHHRANALAMFLDEHLQACLWERVRAVTNLPWVLEVDDDRDPEQQMVRDGLTKLVERTPRLRQLRRWLAWNALWCGRSGSQVRWEEAVIDVEGLGKHRGLAVAKHRPIDGDKIGYRYDDTPVVLVNGGYADDIKNATSVYTTESRALALEGPWRERVLIHQVNCVDVDFSEGDRADAIHGLGIRHWLYWSWWNRSEYISATIKALDKAGLGIIVISYETGNTQAEAAATTAAKNLSADRSVLTLPVPKERMGAASPVQVATTPVSGAQVLQQLREACEAREERFIIGQTGSSRSDAGGLGTHDTDFMQKTKADITAEDAGELDETLTGYEGEPGLLSIIKRHTYPWAEFPVRMKTITNPPDPERRLGAATLAFNLGARLKEDQVREVAGFQEPGPDDQVLVSPQYLQLQQQMQQMQGGQQAPGQAPDQNGGGGEEEAGGDSGGDSFETMFGGGQEGNKPEAHLGQLQHAAN